MRFVPLIFASVLLTPLGLAACNRDEPAAPAAAAPAVAASVDPAAEAFVRSLYAVEQGGTGATGEESEASEASEASEWSARTAALVAESEALGNPGEYAYFEANPICACQDDGGMELRNVTVTSRDSDHADAAVVMVWTMAQPVSTIRQTFNLVRENGQWKIDDIQRDQSQEVPQPPLVQDISSWIAERRAEKAKT